MVAPEDKLKAAANKWVTDEVRPTTSRERAESYTAFLAGARYQASQPDEEKEAYREALNLIASPVPWSSVYESVEMITARETLERWKK